MRVLKKLKKLRSSEKKPVKKRDITLDVLKTITIILMILAHTIAFTHNGTNQTVNNIRKFGDLMSFTILFFASGASIYISYLKHTIIDDDTLHIRIINRVLKLLIIYYVVAFASSLHNFPDTINEFIKYLFNIIFFIKLPGYTEFLLPFIILSLTIIPLKKIYKVLSGSILNAVFLGLVLYLVGFLLHAQTSHFPYKALISGDNNAYSFPILQYFIVFLCGISWGRTIIETKPKGKKGLLAMGIALVLGLITLLMQFLPLQNDLNNINYRWPPSLTFILVGLVFSYFIYGLTELILAQNFEIPKIIVKPLHAIIEFLGQNLLFYYTVHLIILQAYSLLWGNKYSNFMLIFVYYLLLIALTTLIIITIQIANEKKKQIFHMQASQSKKVTKFNYSSFIFLLALFIISGTLRAFAYTEKQATPVTPVKPAKNDQGIIWWDDNYAYRRNIVVHNNQVTKTSDGDLGSIELEHNLLIQLGKSLQTGDDLNIVYEELKSDNTTIIYHDIPIKPSELNTDHTQILFHIFKPIEKKKQDDNYYLYYGNSLATEYNQINDYVDNSQDLIKTNSEMLSEEQHPYFLYTGHTWFLKGKELSKEETNINLKIAESTVQTASSILFYEITNANYSGQFTHQGNIFQAQINTQELMPGTYKVQAYSADRKIRSNIVNIKISYPLYIVWSMDWEGYDCKNDYLTAIDKIANKYSIPITHFYNPRIYVGLSKTRQNYLDTWIKARRDNHGDEVELHLHMFLDMVAAAGVTPKTTPQWTNYKDGKDVPATAYTTEEYSQILNWAIGQLEAHGFAKPIAHRAGAWYANPAILQSVEDNDFLIDSSGRTKYSWGTNKIPGFWDLKSTTKPYKPSKANQNKAGNPSFNLYEFPNNGADSWTYSAAQMIQRFDDNYKNKPLNDRQTVTFLSHPHGFNIDGPKLEKLFTYINQYSYLSDKGPVKFVSLSDAYAGWNIKE